MPWEMGEFLRKKVERAQQLLADSEEHRGAPDLQAFVDAMQFRSQLHRALMDGNGRRRAELSDRELMQALVLLLRHNLSALACPLCMVDVEEECQHEAIVSAVLMFVKDRQPGAAYEVTTGGTPEALLGALAFDAWILRPRCGLNATSLEAYDAQCFEAATWSARDQQLAAQLERQLLEGGFSPTISAAQLRLVRAILCHQSSATRFQQTESSVFAGMAKAAGEQMLRLDRSSPGLQLRRALFLGQHAVSALSRAAYASCLERSIAAKGAALNAMIAAHPGQAQLPHILQPQCLRLLNRSPGIQRWLTRTAKLTPDQTAPRPVCASYGKHALQLMKCAACKKAAYCSKQCQAAHWKEGGHKMECRALAGTRKGGISAARS